MASIVAVGAFLSWTLIRDEIKADAAKHLFTLVTEVAKKAESDVATSLQTVSGIAAAIPAAALDDAGAIGHFFSQLPKPLGWIGRCAAVAPDGRVLAHNIVAPAGAITSLAGREYFQKVLAEKKPVVSAPLISGVSGAPTIALSAPRLGTDGTVRVVVTCGLLLTQQGVFGHVRELKVGTGGYLYVASRQRKIVLHPDARRMLGDAPPRGASPLADRAGDGFEGTEEGTDSLGLRALMSFRQMPSLGWFVAAVYPLDEAYQPLRQVRERILLVALAALAVSGALAWLLAGWLVSPLRRLTRKVSVLRDQATLAPPDLGPQRGDEIGELGRTFSGLLGALREREENLKSSAEENRILRAALEQSEEAIMFINSDRQVTLWNHGAEQIFGWTSAEALGNKVRDLHMRDVSEEAYEQMRAQVRQGKSLRDDALRRRKDGTQLRVSSTVTPVFDAQGGYVGALASVRDITELSRSQEALRLSEERFSKAFHSNPDFTMITRMRDGLIVEVNEAFENLLGVSAADAVGKLSVSDLHLWVDPAERERMVQLLREGGSVRNLPAEFATRGGERREMEITASVIDLAGEEHIIGTSRDVTDLKRSQEALRRSEERFANLFRNNPDNTMLSRLSDGQFVDVNHAFESMTGWRREEVIGRTAKDIGLYEDLIEGERLLREPAADGIVRDFEFRFRVRSGEIRLVQGAIVKVELDGEPHALVVTRDVTEIRRAEEALKKSGEKFAKAFHASTDWITVFQMADGAIVETNERVEQICGYSIQEVVGSTDLQMGMWAYPEKRPRFLSDLKAKGWLRDYEWELRTRTGEIRDTLISAATIELDGVPCMLSVVRDVTEQRRAEEEIRNLNVALESRVKERTAELEGTLRELESFSYSISHDLRSPLRAIAGYARIIEEDYAAQMDAEGNRLLRRIVSGAIRMSDLIDDLLDFSRIGRAALKKAPIDMARLAQEVLAELPEANNGQAIDVRIGDLPAIVADRSLMRQVWVNLLSNAIKYSRQRKQAVIEIGGSATGTEAHFFVRDNGIGFDMQFADKLFQVFQRLHRDPAFEGTGVGLAIAARVVQRHGGRVWAESEPDQGATFHFSLPASALA